MSSLRGGFWVKDYKIKKILAQKPLKKKRGFFISNKNMEKKEYHLTPEGYQRYKEEYKNLKKALKENKAKIKEIRDDLWRPEDLNPDYEPIESELIANEMKMKELENVLKNAKIIRKQKDSDPKIVTLGTTVVLEISGRAEEFTIVETLEANPTLGKISNESAVGKALIGKKAGETVIVQSNTKASYKIKKIK